jgi:hypothetical protein
MNYLYPYLVMINGIVTPMQFICSSAEQSYFQNQSLPLNTENKTDILKE